MTWSSAAWIAAVRARESARDDRLFDDPWAALLAGGAGAGPENPFLPVRTRYFDDALRAAAGWARQVVLLGAGLDTRAYRLPLPATTVLYELDMPGMLAGKRAAVPAEPVCDLRQVEVDLRDDWPAALLEAGFEPAVPVVWLAEGLLFHLAPEVVDETLARAARLSGDRAHFLADVFGTGLLEVVRREPPPCCTDDPAGLFARAGWPDCAWDLAGAPAANYGRLRGAPRPGTVTGTDPTMRTYLVTARVSARRR